MSPPFSRYRVAKSRGANVMKQWDATLDGRTRPSHARIDGEIRETDEKHSNGLMFPGDPSGPAEEVIFCRCVSKTRARWALDADELQKLQDRAAYFGLDKTENFKEFRTKYLATTKIVVVDDSSDSGYEPRTKKIYIYIYPNRRMTRLQSFMNMLTPLIEQ